MSVSLIVKEGVTNMIKTFPRVFAGLIGVASLAVTQLSWAGDTSAAAQLAHWSAVAGAAGNAERGRTFFNSRHGKDVSCASCHGSVPTGPGKHSSTGKVLEPLSPASNSKAFTDSAKINKWFRRNCNDVVGRECSAQEKADVIAFLVSSKP